MKSSRRCVIAVTAAFNENTTRFSLWLAKGAEVLTIGEESGTLALYILLFTGEDSPAKKREFILVGNGELIETDGKELQYIATANSQRGTRHLFEIK